MKNIRKTFFFLIVFYNCYKQYYYYLFESKCAFTGNEVFELSHHTNNFISFDLFLLYRNCITKRLGYLISYI